MNGTELPNDSTVALALAHSQIFAYGMAGHVSDVTFAQLSLTTSAAIISMRDMGWNMLATQIGITFNEAAGLQIFILEHTQTTFGATIHTLYRIDEGSRTLLRAVENNRQAFIDALMGSV